MKKNIILILIIATLVIALAVIFNLKNQRFVFDSSSKNIGVFLEGDATSYYKTDDKNIKYFIKKYLAKVIPGSVSEDSKYLQFGVVYYDQDKFLASFQGVISVEYDLFGVADGQIRNMSCSITNTDGYQKNNNVLSSLYPRYRVDGSAKQGMCIYEIGKENFEFIPVAEKLRDKETFIKNINNQSYNSMPLYDYTINTEKRIIMLSVFNNDSKNSEGNNLYLRSVEVAY